MPHNNFLYQTRDIKFQIKEWLDADKVLSCDAYKDYYGIDDFDAICDVCFKICRDVMCPANKDADEIGMKHVGGEELAVISPDVFKTVYNTTIEAGLGPQFGDRQVEGRMPLYWYAPILEMQTGASPAMVMLWCLTQGATTVLQYNLQPELQERFLPKMYSGEWGGSMCLTEPGAGSDVGAVLTKCFPTDTPGLWKIKGQKCFITTGDWDGVPNIIHLVLAKAPDAMAGTAGISCLVTPKFWVNDDGSLGKWNDVTTVGIEHKLGIHGSATCTLAFGENDNCYGWMIGPDPGPDGRGKGMAQMFQMMNEERINTGIFSLGAFASAYYAALDYAKIRVQSKKSTDPKGPSVRIIEHEDVRRMLLLQKSMMEACRALLYKSYYYIDLSKEAATEEERELAEDFFMIQNPLGKAFVSDMAWLMTAEAMQVHGGYGFMEEYAPASLARDCKIYSIWEGTNFMHAQDFTGRKFTMKDGVPFKKWMAEIEEFVAAKTPGFEAEYAMMADALEAFNAIMAFNADWSKNNKQMKQLYATRMLHGGSRIICGKLMLEQAVLAAKKLAELGEDHFDANFYKSKIATVKFFILNVVPEIFGYLKMMQNPDTSSITLAEEAFM